MRASEDGRSFGTQAAGRRRPSKRANRGRHGTPGFVHVTLPTGSVRDLGPCTLPREGFVFPREAVLPGRGGRNSGQRGVVGGRADAGVEHGVASGV